MLTCFFKPSEDKDCKCDIVKFVDRIWLDKRGNASLIRDFIIHVKEGSIPLSGIRLFIPYQNVLDIQDLTDTCYDEDYFFNTFHAGGFSVEHLDLSGKRGIVNVDGVTGVEVYAGIGKNLNIAVDPVPPQRRANILSIDFLSCPIEPGKFRRYRISFKITSVADLLFEGDFFRISLSYFDGSHFRDETKKLDISDLEVPVKKFYKEITEAERKIYYGGVDIFLYLDSDIKGAQFNSNKELVARHEFNATEGERNRQKYIWRARLCFPKRDVLTMDNPTWDLHGYISDPYQFKRIDSRLDRLETTSDFLKQRIIGLWKDRKWLVISIIIGIIALIFGAYSVFVFH